MNSKYNKPQEIPPWDTSQSNCQKTERETMLKQQRKANNLWETFTSELSGITYSKLWKKRAIIQESICRKGILQKWMLNKVKQFITSRTALQETLKEILLVEMKGY